MKVIVVQNPSGFDVPVGGIILWYGLAANIPSGFEVYTEAGGYFLMGGSATNLTPGGAAMHAHDFPNVAAQPDHVHAANVSVSGYAGSTGTGYNDANLAAAPNHVHSGSSTVSAAGAHTHAVANANAASSLPAYHRLYYIRRTS